MGTRDARVDAYIANAAEFAQPILTHVREVVHAACPDVEETLKWRFPHFMYHGMLCGVAAFKEHCALGFWKGTLIIDPKDGRSMEAMGQFGRITSVKDLPSKKVLAGYIKQAMQLNERGVKAVKRKHPPKPPAKVPDVLVKALARNKKAKATFDGFPPSHRREYIDWIAEAKTDETRTRRLTTAIEWLAEGKQRNWKYMNC